MIPSWPSIAIHTITVCDEFYTHDCFITQEYTGLRVVESKLLTGTFKYLLILQCISSSAYICTEHGDHSGYRLNQWEMLLQCIDVSYWLIPFPEWSLQNIPKRSMYCDFLSFLMFCLCFFYVLFWCGHYTMYCGVQTWTKVLGHFSQALTLPSYVVPKPIII